MDQGREEVDVRFNEFPNIGFITAKLPHNVLEPILSEVSKMQVDFEDNIKYQSTLVGHMEHAYKLVDSIPTLEPFVLHLTNMYDDKRDYKESAIMHPLGKLDTELSSCWVNFQQKHEFNPPHVHRGLMSFVIWIQIPYDIDKEEAHFPYITEGNKTSKFQFHYSDTLGIHRQIAINVNKDMEGVICLFPAGMMHSVNPFYTSDGFRISIAGNVGFKTP